MFSAMAAYYLIAVVAEPRSRDFGFGSERPISGIDHFTLKFPLKLPFVTPGYGTAGSNMSHLLDFIISFKVIEHF